MGILNTKLRHRGGVHYDGILKIIISNDVSHYTTSKEIFKNIFYAPDHHTKFPSAISLLKCRSLPGQNWDKETQSSFPMWVTNTRLFALSSAASQVRIAGNGRCWWSQYWSSSIVIRSVGIPTVPSLPGETPGLQGDSNIHFRWDQNNHCLFERWVKQIWLPIQYIFMLPADLNLFQWLPTTIPSQSSWWSSAYDKQLRFRKDYAFFNLLWIKTMFIFGGKNVLLTLSI